MAEKKYFWLRLQHDFFQSKRIKKLRRLAGGDTYTIIYLKMQLKAILNKGVLTYTGIEPTFAEEIALDIDEEADNVSVTVNYLLSCGLMEAVDGNSYILPYAVENTGRETEAAERMRRLRESRKNELPPSNEQERTKFEQCSEVFELCSDIESNNKSKNKKYIERREEGNVPTLAEVEEFAKERNSAVAPKKFFDFYDAASWHDKNGKPVLNWKQKFLTWENHETMRNPPSQDQKTRDETKTMEQVKKLREKINSA